MEKAFKTLLLMLAVMLYLGSTAHAEKRMDIISMKNGYPRGDHFTLNIQGKKNTFTCESDVDGNSVFISEYGNSTINFISNKEAGVTELTVLDSCSEAFDGDAAQVQLPYQAEGYYVFARLKGKPKNSKTSGDPKGKQKNSKTSGDPSNVLLVPNPVLKVWNDTDGSLMTLGLVTNEGVYKMKQKGLFQFDPSTKKGGGTNIVEDITGLFKWTGYVLNASLDTSGPRGVPDGVIDIYDLPPGFDADWDRDTDQVDFDLWCKYQTYYGLGRYYENRYIWDLADLVVQEQTIVNDGSKRLEIRWYPIAPTSFIPDPVPDPVPDPEPPPVPVPY